MKISSTIITFNEEHNIQDCIESLLKVADEIVIVDSFSTDNTKVICERYELVKFIENKFDGHVEQKNFAIAQSQFDYVLSLDADERLSKELQQEIRDLKATAQPDLAYSMPRLNNYCGQWIRHSGMYPERKVRFWNKQKGKWGGVNPHDKVILSDNLQATKLKGDLLHYTTSSLSTHLTQVNKFSEIAAEQLLKNKKRPNAVFKMLFDPPFMFFKKYFFQLGILDGFHGFTIAIISAHAKFLKYAKYIQKKKALKQ